MARVIAEPASRVKDNSCVEVRAVDCIHPTLEEPNYPEVEMGIDGQRVDDIALLLSLLGVLAIGGVVLGVLGQWLVRLGHFGNVSGWVGASIGLLALTPAIGGVGGQRRKRTRRLATELIANRAPAAIDLRELLNDRWSRRANYAAVILVVLILALMVFKP